MTTHGHRRQYTMTAKAYAQRRMARQCRVMKKGSKPSRAGASIGLHITEQAAAILQSYQQGRARRGFLTDAILNHSA